MGSYRKRSSDMKGIKSRESELLGKGLGTIRQAGIRLGPALDSGEEGLVEGDLVEPLVEHRFRQDFETKERAGREGTMWITKNLIGSASDPVGPPSRGDQDSRIDEGQRQALDPPRRSATSRSIPSQSRRGSPESTIRWRICHSRLPSGVCGTGSSSRISCGTGVSSLRSLPGLAMTSLSYHEARLDGRPLAIVDDNAVGGGATPTPVGAKPTAVGTPPTSVGSNPTRVGVLPASVETAPTHVWVAPTPVGDAPTAVGDAPTPVGAKPTAVGTLPTLVGSNPTRVGMLPTPVGAKPTTVGMLPTSVGSNPTRVGMPPTPVGAKPTAVGETPAAGGATHPGGRPFALSMTNSLAFEERTDPRRPKSSAR